MEKSRLPIGYPHMGPALCGCGNDGWGGGRFLILHSYSRIVYFLYFIFSYCSYVYAEHGNQCVFRGKVCYLHTRILKLALFLYSGGCRYHGDRNDVEGKWNGCWRAHCILQYVLSRQARLCTPNSNNLPYRVIALFSSQYAALSCD